MSAGGIAGFSSWFIGYPIDFLKTKIQTQDLDNKVYKGMLDCFRQNVQRYGWKCLTRGLVTVCLRAFPVNAVAFYVEDEVGYLLDRKEI